MLLESVPNISEGRRPALIERFASAARSAVGAHLLDLSSDADHHRSVLTLAGRPEALEEALVGLYRLGLAQIDLTRHRGVHPRVGVVDVAPFVPLENATMADAVAAARSLASRVAAELELPVYLYEAAAATEVRRNLADIRRGGLEGLAGRIEDPAWAPDFGPRTIDPRRGVAVVGARALLVAFNAELATGDVTIARRIARSVRESSGGLRAVKAMGVRLARLDRAQVSMNLVDFSTTSPTAALEVVRSRAVELGTEVVATEIVGLVPEAALADGSPDELQIKNFSSALVLEEQLRRRGLID